jgi:transmembrane sensor
MKKNKAKSLLGKYAAGQCTPEEIAIVESWYIQQQHDGVKDLMEKERLADMHEIRSLLIGEIRLERKSVRRLWPRIAAAASILLFLSIGIYYLLHKSSQQLITQSQKNDIAPGSNKAILTLANGKQISLTDAKNGNIAQQGSADIKKTANGQVVYNAKAPTSLEKVAEATYNTITTPRGGQYHLTLADGTNVWLNAASSITFPTAFTGKDRSVKITGEAYFEIVHNAVMPFKVTVNGQTIEDIGTHFNINAYNDEPVIKTTLLEGAVKVSKGKISVMLKPGQQSMVMNKGDNSFVNISNDVNTDLVMAWKNGKFSFHNSDIQTVMRQFGRWYNVEIEYEGKIPSTIFSGEIYRNVDLSKALEILRFTNINFRVEGRKIVVTP